MEYTETTANFKDGTFAGSILKINNAIKNIIEYTNCNLEDIIKMTSINPTKQTEYNKS
ncbi:hypothetical protein [Peribacillus aracenensis]|uniref:hypothetical protein n=1 Tax=Peribacillus aracenensis TaxID=2976708 RepID=UPI0021A3A3FB|nr:hypothetical protein [Peribacillus sp. BBB004]